MGKWIAGGAAILVLIGLLIGVYGFGPKDDEMIYSALQDSISASKEGRPYGVIEHLAGNFTYNSDVPQNRGQISQVIRQLKPDVTVMSRDLRIEGEKASMRCPVKVRLQGGIQADLENVEIVFRKEFGTRWGVFPYARWRVQSVKADGFDPSVFMGGGLPF